jgi:uncharacterized membrane protein YvlD (DUF360 family)
MADNERRREGNIGITSIILRIILTTLVVGIAALFTPGFSITNLWALLTAGVVIAALDYLIERLFGIDASPFGRGIVGFIVSAVILYLTRYIVPGFDITIFGALLGALVIGVLDALIPGKVM